MVNWILLGLKIRPKMIEMKETPPNTCNMTHRDGIFHRTGFSEYSSSDLITDWWYTYPSEKYESQLGLLFPICGK